MGKLFLFVVAFFSTATAMADKNKVYSLDINYLLHKDGSASVTEIWDIDAVEGTEWYLPRENMRDIEVRDFMVHDERGKKYIVDEPWDIDRKLEEKAGRCGINETDDGLELCWGLGSYGRHSYVVEYTLTNAVQNLNDYDMFHFQTVNRKLSTAPEKVMTIIEVQDFQLDTTNTRLWGFGYEGSARIVDGKAYFASSEPFVTESSMICLLRFEKGIFDGGSILEKDFEEHLAAALENSGYVEDEPNGWAIAGGIVGGLLLLIFGIVAVVRASRRQILGMNYDEVQESKEIPFGGNLYVASLVLEELLESRKGSSVAAALIIRTIYKKVLLVRKVDDKNVEFRFNADFKDELDGPAVVLYNMLKDASGSDGVLREDEFDDWTTDHEKRAVRWEKAIEKAAEKFVEEKGYKSSDGRYNAVFQMEACKLLGLKKFLSNYPELKQTDIADADLLKEYLVYAALFEMAAALIEQVNAVNPAFFEESGYFDYLTWNRLIRHNTQLSRIITATVEVSGFSGTGGRSSFGGGAGFSGGGVGGGAR